MTIILKNKDTLVYKEFKFQCSIGKNGKSKNKIAKELFTKKYRLRVVRPKKGKGSFKRKKV